MRAPRVVATALTAAEMAGSRMASVTSVPPTRTYSSCGLVLISSGRFSAAASTAAASSRSVPVSRQNQVSARYMAPVSR